MRSPYPSDLPDLLVNPTLRVLRATVRSLLTKREPADPAIRPAALPGLGEALRTAAGHREWLVNRLDARGRLQRTELTVSWWTQGTGTRYVRLRPFALCGEHTPKSRFSDRELLTPWAVTLSDRYHRMLDRRAARLQALLARRLAGSPSQRLHLPSGDSGGRASQALPDPFREGVLVARADDQLLLADRKVRPQRAALIQRDLAGNYRYHWISVAIVAPATGKRRAPTQAARLTAASNHLLGKMLDVAAA